MASTSYMGQKKHTPVLWLYNISYPSQPKNKIIKM
uniref:Uncharacterized protein n=1 Tax=Anguilla anguilla TaxID=7936 RepID=A0A0E9VBI1_ANGAN